ncbi:DUF4148 domain-containing protein [Paraburkholderia sp. C35]|uniref:DUF4148 domain-containing protein n=1 Tax=Paraburkholderia sp. C35 TaxID=2126993 RepID=UPI000D695FCF|nr:DUF4148 domain-containing protein [Paraburkholderia sp. C35]
MKTSIAIAMIAAALAMPALSYAKVDSNQGTTRTEVKAQIVQAEQDGTLHQSKIHYPDYAPKESTAAQQSISEYGSMPTSFSQSGSPANGLNNSKLFEHH